MFSPFTEVKIKTHVIILPYIYLSPDGDDVMRFVWNVFAYHGKSVLILMQMSEVSSR